MIGQLYTLGYTAPDAEQQLMTLMADPSMLLIDIRYSPRSRWQPQWNRKALQATWGDRYKHVRALGNVNYRFPDAPIQLLDADAGIQWAIETLQAGYSLILLCACRDYERCHRKTVKELIEDARTVKHKSKLFFVHTKPRDTRGQAGFFLFWKGGACDPSESHSDHL